MHVLATKILKKSNAAPGELPHDLMECQPQSNGQVVVSNYNSSCVSSDFLVNEDDNFTRTSSISDHLKMCGNVDLNDALGQECNIGNSIEEPRTAVDWWFINQLHKEVEPGA